VHGKFTSPIAVNRGIPSLPWQSCPNPSRDEYASERTRVKNFLKRPKDVSKAVRLLRQGGVRVGLPMQKADGEMIFPVEDFTFSAREILELLDKNELHHAAIRRLGEAQKGNAPDSPAQSRSKK